MNEWFLASQYFGLTTVYAEMLVSEEVLSAKKGIWLPEYLQQKYI